MKNPTTERKNVNYVIIDSIQVGELEYVLGKHETAEKYVTWQYYNEAYYYGHYINDYKTAKIDLYTRVIDEMEYSKQQYNNLIKELQGQKDNDSIDYISKEKLTTIAQNAINELEFSEYEHDAILTYLDISEEEYQILTAKNEYEKK